MSLASAVPSQQCLSHIAVKPRRPESRLMNFMQMSGVATAVILEVKAQRGTTSVILLLRKQAEAAAVLLRFSLYLINSTLSHLPFVPLMKERYFYIRLV